MKWSTVSVFTVSQGTVGDRSLGHPDAGAYGLGVIFTQLAKDAQ